MMKNLLLLLLSVFLVGNTFSQERILYYNSDITVEESGDILVKEEIKVNAEGNEIKRGIYRSFPTTYKDKAGTRFKVDFDVVEVQKNGAPEPYFTERKGNGVFVYIGDSNVYLTPDEYIYTLVYRTSRQIGFYENFDELYFNAIGGDWTFPIEEATVTVQLPTGATVEQLAAFSGPTGSTSCDCTILSKDNRVEIKTNTILNPREQLTFAVAWPKGFVKEPTTAQKTANFFKDNFHVLFAILGIALVAFLYYRAWKKVGVDPKKGTIIPLFDPPAGYSPAQISFVHRMFLSPPTITAAVVNMAVKGYLIIENTKKKYTLKKTSGESKPLSKEEEAFAKSLFSGKSQIELDNKNHESFTKAKKSMHKVLKEKMKPKYFSLNHRYLMPGIITAIIVVIMTFILSPGAGIPFLTLFLLLVLTFLFFYLIMAPTIKGRALKDEIEGFKMYLEVAEQKQLDALHEPDMTIERFEKLLPFAIAVGLENKWGEKFEKALQSSLQEVKDYHPTWYVAGGMMAFSPRQFSSSVGSSFSSAISSASVPPGSSSGSGGGGFSGGGGGGGGGGGW